MTMRAPLRRFCRFATLVLVAGPLLFAPEGIAADPSPAKAEADLKAVKTQIDKVKAAMERDAGKRDKLKPLPQSLKVVER